MSLPLEALPRMPGTYSRAVPIVPADGVLFDPVRAVYIGTGGILVGQTSDGGSVFTIVASGTILKLRMNAVASSITSASNMLALY